MGSANRKKFTLDAASQAPGRLASRIATLLMGKHKPTYAPHLDRGDRVVVTNIGRMIFSGKKLEQKEYLHHTMHPGGLKSMPAKELLEKNPQEVLKHAVARMIPKNKFRVNRLRRIKFE